MPVSGLTVWFYPTASGVSRWDENYKLAFGTQCATFSSSIVGLEP